MDIVSLKGVVKEYAWGNSDYIPSLVGHADGKPKAELWIGTHSSGEAVTEDGTKLSDYLREHPEMSPDCHLPLLFKVLAIENPLSLQCHPDKAQAEEGWAKEKEKRDRGLECSYHDENEKAEVIAAVSPVTAMCGFRRYEEIVSNFKAMFPHFFEKHLKNAHDIKELFLSLYSLSALDRMELITEYRSSVESSSEPLWSGSFLTDRGIAARLLSFYPEDIGTVSPYMLNTVRLQIGEALYLKPGTLHSYVHGNGVELMSASDNVLRGGLTQKRVDLDELLSIMSFSSSGAEKVKSSYSRSGLRVYDVPSRSFSLLSASTGDYLIREQELRIAIVIEGSVRIAEAGESRVFQKGSIFLIGRSQGEYSMRVRGVVYFAGVPEVNGICGN